MELRGANSKTCPCKRLRAHPQVDLPRATHYCWSPDWQGLYRSFPDQKKDHARGSLHSQAPCPARIIVLRSIAADISQALKASTRPARQGKTKFTVGQTPKWHPC